MKTCTAFEGMNKIARGELPEVARAVKAVVDARPEASVLVFDDATSQVVELDLRGSVDDVLGRLVPAAPKPAAVGRPKLGVVAREVTLLPRHWEWLARQPGGASVALRKLVEIARRSGADHDETRQRCETTYRFLSAMAGNLPGFEEAARALFAGAHEAFAKWMADWPADIRDHALRLVAPGRAD